MDARICRMPRSGCARRPGSKLESGEVAGRADAQGASPEENRGAGAEPKSGGPDGQPDGNPSGGEALVSRGIARQAQKLGQVGGSGDRTARPSGSETLKAVEAGERASEGRQR
jgi:hypothetical protein